MMYPGAPLRDHSLQTSAAEPAGTSNPSKHLRLHPLAQNMPNQDMRFLDPGCIGRGYIEQNIADFRHFTTGSTGETNDEHALCFCRFDGFKNVR